MKRLDEIEARANAATPGPWDYQCGHDTPSGWQDAYVLGADGESVVSGASDGNAKFIAAARTTVPRLVDALEAVLEMHSADEDGDCAECIRRAQGRGDQSCPCPTVTTITTALEGGARE